MIAFYVCYVYLMCVVVSICFFKQKTAYEMRISDWSSDVCSSDLEDRAQGCSVPSHGPPCALLLLRQADYTQSRGEGSGCASRHVGDRERHPRDRKSVVSGKSV